MTAPFASALHAALSLVIDDVTGVRRLDDKEWLVALTTLREAAAVEITAAADMLSADEIGTIGFGEFERRLSLDEFAIACIPAVIEAAPSNVLDAEFAQRAFNLAQAMLTESLIRHAPAEPTTPDDIEF